MHIDKHELKLALRPVLDATKLQDHIGPGLSVFIDLSYSIIEKVIEKHLEVPTDLSQPLFLVGLVIVSYITFWIIGQVLSAFSFSKQIKFEGNDIHERFSFNQSNDQVIIGTLVNTLSVLQREVNLLQK